MFSSDRPQPRLLAWVLPGGLKERALRGAGTTELDSDNLQIYIVDDDEDVRKSIAFMLGTAGRSSMVFPGGREFLDRLDTLEPGCLLIDIRMPDIDGLQVLSQMERRQVRWPSVVMTGHGEIWVAVEAMKLGAIDFLEKPFREEHLLACLDRAAGLLQD